MTDEVTQLDSEAANAWAFCLRTVFEGSCCPFSRHAFSLRLSPVFRKVHPEDIFRGDLWADFGNPFSGANFCLWYVAVVLYLSVAFCLCFCLLVGFLVPENA